LNVFRLRRDFQLMQHGMCIVKRRIVGQRESANLTKG
jgi:hypothetical protein